MCFYSAFILQYCLNLPCRIVVMYFYSAFTCSTVCSTLSCWPDFGLVCTAIALQFFLQHYGFCIMHALRKQNCLIVALQFVLLSSLWPCSDSTCIAISMQHFSVFLYYTFFESRVMVLQPSLPCSFDVALH